MLIIEIHTKVILWYIFPFYEVTETALCHWVAIHVLLTSSILLLISVIPVALTVVIIVVSGSPLWLTCYCDHCHLCFSILIYFYARH